MSGAEQLVPLSLPNYGSHNSGKSTSDLAKQFGLTTDKMLRLLEKLERQGSIRRLPRKGYVWFRK